MICSQCRQKSKELDTRWERMRNWLFNHLFPTDILDLSQTKFTQGFADGYKMGFEKGDKIFREMNEQKYKIGDPLFQSTSDYGNKETYNPIK